MTYRLSVAASTKFTVEKEGKDAALWDFIAGMTDRYAVSLFEQLYIPRPWVGPGPP